MGYVRPKRAKRPANRPKWPSHSLRRRVWTTRFFEIHDPGAFDEHLFNGLLKPMHGGAVAEAKEVEYEFVASADKLQLYMRDHGKPVAVTGMTAKVTLLAGSEKQEVQLQVGDGKLEASGSFKVPAGTKAVVAVSKAGKSVASVRFTLK